MSLILVLLTCSVYQKGCSETTNAYYLSTPGLQEAAVTMETRVKNRMSQGQIAAASFAFEIIRSKDVAIPITQRVNFKVSTQSGDSSILYSIPF